MSIAEEYIYELCRAVGNAYNVLDSHIGNLTTPGTALFDISQISNLAKKNLPYFGILDSADVDLSFDVDFTGITTSEVKIGAGNISYANNVYQIPTQYVKYSREFAESYPADYAYGVVLGFPISEAKNMTQIQSTIVNITAPIGSYKISVLNPTVATNLGFPIRAHVGATYVNFVGIDNGYLIVDPTNDSLPEIREGTQVYFLYQPRIKSLCGLPVAPAHQSGLNVSSFAYYPPMPQDWLPIARFLVNVKDPGVPGDIPMVVSQAVERLVIQWPYGNQSTPVFSTADAKNIAAAADAAGNSFVSLKNSIYLDDIIQALQSYTSAVNTDSTLSFRQFWAQRPYKPNTHFTKGVSFDNLERFEFPESFINAYYKFTGEDLQHTFAIFRGDMYQNSGTTWFDVAPANVTVQSIAANNIPTTLRNGTYVYGVTAVKATSEETNAKYVSCVSGTTGNFVNEIKQTLETENAAYYNIYRKNTIIGDQVEYLLTSANEITSLLTPTGVTITGTSNCLLDDSSKYYAIKLDKTGGSLFGGIGLKLRFADGTTVANVDQKIEVYLYQNIDSTAVVSQGTSLYYDQIFSSTEYSECISRFDPINLDDTASETWILLKLSALPKDAGNSTVGLYILQGTQAEGSSSFGSTAYPLTNPLPTIVESTDHETYYKYYGYLDNGIVTANISSRKGIRLTGAVAKTPRQLRIYVPHIEMPVVEVFSRATNEPDLTTDTTRNELKVTIVAQNGEYGVKKTFVYTVPQKSIRGSFIPVGTTDDVFDRIFDISVSPGSTNNLLISQGQINWSIYDLITVETTP